MNVCCAAGRRLNNLELRASKYLLNNCGERVDSPTDLAMCLLLNTAWQISSLQTQPLFLFCIFGGGLDMSGRLF